MNMNGMRLAILTMALMGVTQGMMAQIAAPVLQCVNNDTLFWQPTPNACGPFVRYEVYAATDRSGPYSLLADIGDPATTQYYHGGVNNQIWYYYLRAIHDCPGQAVTASDTLDNRIPLAGAFHFVTIDGGNVVLNWAPSASVQTIAYIISRIGALGVSIVDTVYADTTYIDTGATPTVNAETYFVEALDACGNKSLIPPAHTTLLMNYTAPNACNTGLVLTWSAYTGWANGVAEYEVFVGADGATPVAVGRVPGSQTTFTYTDTNDGEILCFYVEALEGTTPYRSRSQELCTTVSIVQPIREVLFLGASVNEQAGVDVEWWWDPRARLADASLLRTTGGGSSVDVPVSVVPPLAAMNVQTDAMADGQTRAVSYQLEVLDECGNMLTSNTSTTPFLTGVITNAGHVLSWEPYSHVLATGIRYELLRVGATGTEIVVYSGTDLKYTDAQAVPAAEGTCYVLLVYADYALSSGQTAQRVLRSNTQCLLPTPKVYVPNVFAPNGVNNIFRPQLSLGFPSTYEMAVFDRWGGQVFQSNDIDTGWDGNRNGEPLPQGIYIYFIRLTTSSGETVDIQGDVMLLR